MDKARPKVAVNLFVIRDNQILLGKRKNVPGDGDWGLPGGHLEFMEKLSEGAKRELEEETGIRVENISLFNTLNDPLTEDNSHYIHFNFVVENVKEDPKLMEPDKCYEWKWFSFGELPKNIFLGHRNSIKAFFGKVSFVD